MATEDQVRLILRNKANYIIRSVFEVSDYYGTLKEKDGIGCVVLPYLFLKRIIFITLEEYEGLGVESGDEPEEVGRRIDQLLDDELKIYFLDQCIPDKNKDDLVLINGYLPDEEEGRISLLFAVLLCKKAIAGYKLDEDEQFFVNFIGEYGKPKYLAQFATPKFGSKRETEFEKLQKNKFKGWEQRLRQYMKGIKKEFSGSSDVLRSVTEEQLMKKLGFVSGEEARGKNDDQ